MAFFGFGNLLRTITSSKVIFNARKCGFIALELKYYHIQEMNNCSSFQHAAISVHIVPERPIGFQGYIESLSIASEVQPWWKQVVLTLKWKIQSGKVFLSGKAWSLAEKFCHFPRNKYPLKGTTFQAKLKCLPKHAKKLIRKIKIQDSKSSEFYEIFFTYLTIFLRSI